MVMMINNKRGGARPGAGRKPGPDRGRTYSFYLRASLGEQVKKYVAKLRAEKKAA
jgi:hypothetical protein